MSWHAYLPWKILASIVLAENSVITHLVPFVTLGGSKDRKIIIGAATFNKSKCRDFQGIQKFCVEPLFLL